MLGRRCWRSCGLLGRVDDPRTGNAALHDFHELLIIAFARCCAAVRAPSIWRCLRSRRKATCVVSSNSPTDCRATTLSAGCFADWSRISSEPCSSASASFHAVRRYRVTARCCAVRSTASGSRRCTCQRLAASNACVRRSPPMCRRDHAVPSFWDAVAEDDRDRRRAHCQRASPTDRDRRRLCPGLEGPGSLHDDVRLYLVIRLPCRCVQPMSTPITAASDANGGSLDRYRLVAGKPRVAWAGGHRQSRADTRNNRENNNGNSLLSAQRGALARALNEVCASIGSREPPPLRLDVVMNEDQDRPPGNAPHNLAILRHMAMNAMQKRIERLSRGRSSKPAGTTPSFKIADAILKCDRPVGPHRPMDAPLAP